MTSTDTAPLPVRTLLAVAGLSPSSEEIAVMEEQYPMHRSAVEQLYAVPELRYESPALVFTATPVFADWSAPAQAADA